MNALVCEWCGVEFVRRGQRGPVPRYCKDSHRQRAYEARRYTEPMGDDVTRAVKVRVHPGQALLVLDVSELEDAALAIDYAIDLYGGGVSSEVFDQWEALAKTFRKKAKKARQAERRAARVSEGGEEER